MEIHESDILACATPQSFKRGDALFQQGAVESLSLRGGVLQSEVAGSEYRPYRVSVVLGDNGINDADCSCLYAYEGLCKHIVAALLAYLNGPETVEEQPALADLLTPLSREQLVDLVVQLGERDSSLADKIAVSVAALMATNSAKSSMTGSQKASAKVAQTVKVDTAALRRQVRGALGSLDRMRSSEAYWHIGGVVREVFDAAQPAQVFLEAGDGRNALAVLQAVTEEYLREWECLDDSDGEASSFFTDIGPLWTEAVLSADLTLNERETWEAQFDAWQGDLDEYGVEDAFRAAEEAARQGWDAQPLALVLAGKSKSGLWPDERPWHADELVTARLRVLERREQFEKYLRLAKADRQTALYAAMLVKLGRIAEAVKAGKELRAFNDCLLLAQALRDAGATAEAMDVAERGLKLKDSDSEDDEFLNHAPGKATLAAFLCELAGTSGQHDRALEAGRIVVLEDPQLKAYLHLRKLCEAAGKKWPKLRDETLEALRHAKSHNPSGLVDIFLHEGQMDDALKIVSNSWDNALIGRVVDAAWPTRPDEVIPICLKKADVIMDGGKSEVYGEAARWLERAKAAYGVADRLDEWTNLLQRLLEKHRKKYRLRPLLEALRR